MTEAVAAARSAGGLLVALRVFAALAVLTLLSQFVTAGQLFPRPGPIELHEAGAIVLHVVSGLAAVAAVVLWLQHRVTLWLVVLAVVVFALGFVQAAVGDYQTLYLHVPGAMLLTAGAVWLLVAVARPLRAVSADRR